MTKQIWTIIKVNDGIYDYIITGSARDHEWILANRKMVEMYMYDEVRSAGYLPILDESPELSYEYDSENELFTYRVSMPTYKVRDGVSEKFYGILLNDGVAISKNFDSVALCDAL
jgi:hypothetical protein